MALEQLINIETDMRGFVITGKDSFLEPLVAGENRFSVELELLKRLTVDNLAQQQRLATLSDTQKRWLAEDVEPIVALRKRLTASNLPDDELDTRISSGADKAKMGSMRATLAEITATETALLAQRSQEMIDTKHMAPDDPDHGRHPVGCVVVDPRHLPGPQHHAAPATGDRCRHRNCQRQARYGDRYQQP